MIQLSLHPRPRSWLRSETQTSKRCDAVSLSLHRLSSFKAICEAIYEAITSPTETSSCSTQTKGHDVTTMDFGQLFIQISHLQIHHLIQVNAPDRTDTGSYVIDVSLVQRLFRGLPGKENIKMARDTLSCASGHA